MRRAIPFLIFIWASGAVQASAAITAQIDTNVTSGPAPLAVSFNATGTRHSNSSIDTNRFRDLVYLWDYDDPGSGTWAPTGKSRNHMSGPLGAHVFEPSSFPDCGGRCKEYVVRLTVKDALEGSSSTTKTIVVFNPDDPTNGWGATGKSICISRNGNFSGCPGVATRETNSGTFDSILSSKIGAGYRRILFHAGESWSITSTYSLNLNGPGLIGSYGGGKATLNSANQRLMVHGDDWRIQDIHFAGYTSTDSMIGAWQQVKNLLLQRTTSETDSFRGMLKFSVEPLSGGDENAHRHIFIVDNHWQKTGGPSGFAGHNIYGIFWGLNLLGNRFEGAPGSHTVRITTGEDVFISNNYLGPNLTSKTVLNLRDMPNACTDTCPGSPFCGRRSKHYLVQDNDFRCNYYTCIGVGMQTCMTSNFPLEPMPQEDFVFERNFFKRAAGASMGGSAINPDATNGANIRFEIRNNILDETGWDWTTGFIGSPGIRIRNNTCYRSDAVALGRAVCVLPNGADECYNNVMYAPNWTGSVLRWESPDSSCKSESNNFDNGPGGNITRPPFVSTSPSVPADFTPGSGSQLIDSAKPVAGVFDDYFANCRPGASDVGAIERGASMTCAGVSVPVIPQPDPDPEPQPTPAPGPQPTPAPGPQPTPAPGPQPTPAPGPQPIPAPAPVPPTSNGGGDWVDTRAGNSMAEDDSLFQVVDLGGNQVFGTSSTQTNIHSHYITSASAGWSAYEFRGRMLITDPSAGIGVTLHSKYTTADAYYRILHWGSSAFEMEAHPYPTPVSCESGSSGVVPQANQWYRFRFEVTPNQTSTSLRAKVWRDGTSEPSSWQIRCEDGLSDRLRSGTVGVWSMGAGSKYWDDLEVTVGSGVVELIGGGSAGGSSDGPGKPGQPRLVVPTTNP